MRVRERERERWGDEDKDAHKLENARTPSILWVSTFTINQFIEDMAQGISGDTTKIQFYLMKTNMDVSLK